MRPVFIYEKRDEQLCEFSIPGKEYSDTCKNNFKCGVMYECPWKKPTIERQSHCVRYQIGKNKLEQGAKLLKISNGRTTEKNQSDGKTRSEKDANSRIA